MSLWITHALIHIRLRSYPQMSPRAETLLRLLNELIHTIHRLIITKYVFLTFIVILVMRGIPHAFVVVALIARMACGSNETRNTP